MGFLDRMVSDLIRDATGVNPRRLVRMVGGKNILLAGGAALAGGLLKEKLDSSQPATHAAPPRAPGSVPAPPGAVPPPPGAVPPPPPGAAPKAAAPPPPPPASVGAVPPPPQASSLEVPPPPQAPASAVPPPPPIFAVDEAPDEEVALPQELTYAIVRTMVAAALADGELAAVEKDTIQRRLGESGLSGEQVRQVHADLQEPPSPEALAALADAPQAREAMYRFAAAVVLADGKVVDSERAWLDDLAKSLELGDERQGALEKEIFEV